MDLKEKLEGRLKPAKFRIINEKIYKGETKKIKNKHVIEDYHKGYISQIKKWPSNPLNEVIDKLRTAKNLKIADLGCGEAKIQKELGNQNEIYSIDLFPTGESIIKGDIEKLFLKNDEMDVIVYCLSLMKLDIYKCLKEGNRVLKNGGRMLIAEVVSRISNLNEFIEKITQLGFSLIERNEKNSHFVLLEFEKVKECEKVVSIHLKPCLYKRR